MTKITYNNIFIAIIINIYGGTQPLEVLFILNGDVFVFWNDLLLITCKIIETLSKDKLQSRVGQAQAQLNHMTMKQSHRKIISYIIKEFKEDP